MGDHFDVRRAKNADEYAKAREMVQWVLERAGERPDRGHVTAAIIIRVAANKIRDFFLVPLEQGTGD